MLGEGDKAPPFRLESDAGKTVSLGDFAGRTLVVYFYPKDDTPGCTREALAFSGLAGELAGAGASVVGISRDSVASHCRFRDKHRLTIPLLSDPDLAVHRAFGAWGEKTMYGRKVEGTIRSTFVIDGDGVIRKVYPSVKVDGHAEAVLAFIKQGSASAGAGSNGAAARARSAAEPSSKTKATATRSRANASPSRPAAKKGAAKAASKATPALPKKAKAKTARSSD